MSDFEDVFGAGSSTDDVISSLGTREHLFDLKEKKALYQEYLTELGYFRFERYAELVAFLRKHKVYGRVSGNEESGFELFIKIDSSDAEVSRWKEVSHSFCHDQNGMVPVWGLVNFDCSTVNKQMSFVKRQLAVRLSSESWLRQAVDEIVRPTKNMKHKILQGFEHIPTDKFHTKAQHAIPVSLKGADARVIALALCPMLSRQVVDRVKLQSCLIMESACINQFVDCHMPSSSVGHYHKKSKWLNEKATTGGKIVYSVVDNRLDKKSFVTARRGY